MKRFLLCIIAVSGFYSGAHAQQDPLYAQYLNNPLSINPAYAGLNNNFNIATGYRTQWTGFDGHPETFTLNSHISLVDNKVGAGFVLSSDKIGNVNNTEFQGTFSYKLELADDKVFSFGLQGGFINFRNNITNLNLADETDEVFTQNGNVTKPNFGAGMILKSERYMVGLSVPRLLSTNISVMSNGALQNYELYNKHYYLFGAYVFYLNERLRFKPSTLLKIVKGAPASVDLNLNLNIDQNYTVGAYTRNFTSYGLLLQALFGDKYKLGYAFEVPTSKSVGASFSSHEIYLGIVLPVLSYHQRSVSNF